MKYHRTYLIALGHLVTDINQGALPALLPFLIADYSLSYTAAASLVFAANASSTLIQPAFGHFADKLSKPYLMPAGILLAGGCLAFTGLVHSYWLLLLLATISGIGISAFHPEGARMINQIGGDRKGTAMSTFGVGGNLGFAMGPVLVTPALLAWGVKGTLILIVPVLIAAVWIALEIPALTREAAVAEKKAAAAGGETKEDRWFPFVRLTGAVTCRAIVFHGLNTFIPLYWIYVLHQSKAAGAAALTLMFSAGVVGTFVGGRLGDRYGSRKIMLASFGAVIVVYPLFLLTQNVAILTFLLVPIAFAVFCSFSPMIVLGQKFLPNHIGLASGVTIGMAVSIGGVAAPVMGYIADGHGIYTALALLLIIPALGLLLSLTMPKEQRADL